MNHTGLGPVDSSAPTSRFAAKVATACTILEAIIATAIGLFLCR